MSSNYLQTEVGTIPADWRLVSLGEIGDSIIGLTYRPTDVRSDGILVLRSSNVGDGVLRFDDNVFVQMDIPEKIKVRQGDILICVRNGSRNLIGKCAKIGDQQKGMTFGAFMAVFRSPHHNLVYHQLQSFSIRNQINEHLGATINQITNTSLNSFKIPFPPTEDERQAISSALDDMDCLIGDLEAMAAKKREIKQGVMQALLNGRTRLPGFTKKWGEKRISEIGQTYGGLTGKRKED